uniref:Uncharacterized protein n=1 Tax=Plectus sambesii TaxID=2011161 RepID=A0A914X2R0_9BILA
MPRGSNHSPPVMQATSTPRKSRCLRMRCVAQLVKKLPDIMDDYVKSGETFNYMYEKAVQERMKREFVTGTGNGRNGGHGSGGRYYGPSSSSWFR